MSVTFVPFSVRLAVPDFCLTRSAAAALLVAAALLSPATAVAQQVGAHVTVNLNQRAGPGTCYPAPVVVPMRRRSRSSTNFGIKLCGSQIRDVGSGAPNQPANRAR